MHRGTALAILLTIFTCIPDSRAAAGTTHPVRFEPNRGQADPRWSWVARTADGTLLLGEGQVRLGDASLALVGAAPEPSWNPVEPLPGRAHYLLGADPGGWILDVPTFGAVRQQAAYPGIDVVVRASDARVELEFTVAPSADPAAIGLALDGSGWRLGAPEIGGVTRAFRSAGGILKLDGVDPAGSPGPEVIRIALERTDRAAALEPPRLGADAEGNLYVAGHVAEGPATAFVSRLDPSGRDVLWTTYVDGLDAGAPIALAVAPTGEVALAGASHGDAAVLRLDRSGRAIVSRSRVGGSADDAALAAAFGPDGSLWCAGRTASPDLPVTAGAPRARLQGSTDAFVARLDAEGRAVFVTYLGGEDADEARAVALDRDGAVYATGSTGADAFVAKLEPEGAALAYFTPFGGSGADAGTAIAVSSSGEAAIVGTTRSPDLAIVGGTQAALAGASDGFLARWDRSGRSLVFSTYLGGPSEDGALAIALDRRDHAWVVGRRGTGESADAFVTRVATDGKAGSIERIVAGERGDAAGGVVANGNGDAVVAGLSQSETLPGVDRPESAAGGAVFMTVVEGGDEPLGVCPGTKNFVGGHSLNAWEDPLNWSGASLPTASDDVCIQGFGVTAGAGLQNAGTLRVEGGSLTINGAQITVAGASEINAPLSIVSGTLTGAGNITVTGTFSWTGGTLSGSGITTTNGSVSVGGSATKGLSAHRWDVNGPVALSGTGSLAVSSGGVVNNASTWDCQSDASLVWSVGAATSFNNSGTFKKSGGVGTTTVQMPFNNTGSVQIQTGLMNFNSGGSSSGSYDLAAGTTLEYLGSTYDYNAGTTVTGAGTLLLNVATLNVNADLGLPAGITFNMQGGFLGGLATLTVGGTLNWTGGTMQNGVTTCNGALNLSGATGKGMQSSRVLNVSSSATATMTGTGGLTLSSLAAINNVGTWDCQSDATIAWGVGSAPSFNNTGTFRKSAGTGTTTVQMPFVNGGAVLVQSGTVNFTQGTSSSTGNFDVVASRTVQFGGGNWSFQAGTSFSGAGTVLLSATTLSVDAAVEIPDTMSFDMSGGTLGGVAAFTVRGPMSWSGGTMQSAGITNANGPLNISGAAGKGIQTGRVLNANAATSFAGTGSLNVSSLGVINNAGTWDCQTDATLVWGVGSAPAFNNSGTFKKSGGIATTNVQMPFYNTASVLVQTGTINLSQGGNGSANFDVASGATLLFNGGTYNLDAGTTFTGLGTVVLGTATWNVNAAVSTPPTITLNMSAATAAMNGSGTLTTFGPFNWTGGSMGGNGVTTCQGVMTLSGTASKGISTRTLNTNGATTWSGAGADLGMSFAAVLNNNGTWDVLNDESIAWGVGSAPAFRNFGTFRKSIGVGTTSLSLPFTNSGTVDIQSGTISATGYTQTAGTTQLTGGALSSTANIAIQGGTLAGSGTVTGPVVVSGTGALSPGLSPGSLGLATSYTQQAPNGAFTVELGGNAPAQYDRAAVTGAATLAGVLNVGLINGFVPQPGDSFTIMTYGSHTGTFTQVLPSTGCIGWSVDYGPTAVVLTAAAVPAEISGLNFTSKTALSWTPAPIYAATTYNVLRGDLDKLPVGPGGDEACVIPSTPSTSGSDTATPVDGRGFWYLVREQVAGCGSGTYGFASSGTERISTACP